MHMTEQMYETTLCGRLSFIFGSRTSDDAQHVDAVASHVVSALLLGPYLRALVAASKQLGGLLGLNIS